MRRYLLVLCLIAFASVAVKAQYRGLDTKRIAEMLVNEKKTGQMNDASFVLYLDSLGFTAVKRNGYQKEWTDTDKGVKKYLVNVLLLKEYKKRSVRIEIDDNGSIWWMVLKLKEFGLRESGHNGSAVFLEGKGLHAMAFPDKLWLSYDIKVGR